MAFFSVTSLFAQTNISDKANDLINKFMELRVEISTYENELNSINQIYSFEKIYKDKIQTLNEHEKLIIENLIAIEKYFYLFDDMNIRKDLIQIMKNQKNKNDEYFKKNKKISQNKWLYASSANVTTCYMVFSYADVIKYGASVKSVYEDSLKQDPNFSYALLSYGKWAYNAPKIAGGGKKLAINLFEQAVNNSKTICDSYFAKVFLSQAYFEEGNFEKTNLLIEEIEKEVENSNYINLIKIQNKDGISLFEYNSKRADLKEE